MDRRARSFGQPDAADARGARGAAGEGRSRDRHGARVHRAAGHDGRHLRARGGRARSRSGRRSTTTTCRSASKPTRRRRATQLGAAAVTWAAVSLADKLDTLVGAVPRRRAADGIARSVRAAPAGARACCKILLDLPDADGRRRRGRSALLVDAARLRRCGAGRRRRGRRSRTFLRERAAATCSSSAASTRATSARSCTATSLDASPRRRRARERSRRCRSSRASRAFRQLATRVQARQQHRDAMLPTPARRGRPARRGLKEPAERRAAATRSTRRRRRSTRAVARGATIASAFAEAAAVRAGRRIGSSRSVRDGGRSALRQARLRADEATGRDSFLQLAIFQRSSHRSLESMAKKSRDRSHGSHGVSKIDEGRRSRRRRKSKPRARQAAKYVYLFGTQDRRQRHDEAAARRQGREPRRDVPHRPAGAPGLHHHHRGLHLLLRPQAHLSRRRSTAQMEAGIAAHRDSRPARSSAT